MRDWRTNKIFLRYYFTSKIVSALDAVGLSQIFFPTQNLERAYSKWMKNPMQFCDFSNTNNVQGLRSKKL